MMHMRLLTTVVLAALATAPTDAALTAPFGAGWLEGTTPARTDRYGESRQSAEHTERVQQVFRVGAEGALDLSNVSGDVQVTGTNGNEIRLEATKRVRHRDPDEAARLLQQLRIDITHVGDRVEVRTIYPRRTGNYRERSISASIDYVLSVPAGAAVSVKTISGDATVTRVRGEVRAEAVSGDVDVSATPNVALAKTVSGNVTARDVSGASSLSLNTVSGSVYASDLKVRSLDCGSVSGDIQLSGLQVERLQAKSVSGDIEFGAALVRGGRYDFNSHSGDIRVTLATDAGFELDASTFSGTVRSDFPVTLRAGGASSRDRRGGTRTIRGSFGDAGAILAVQTFSGTVVITRK